MSFHFISLGSIDLWLHWLPFFSYCCCYYCYCCYFILPILLLLLSCSSSRNSEHSMNTLIALNTKGQTEKKSGKTGELHKNYYRAERILSLWFLQLILMVAFLPIGNIIVFCSANTIRTRFLSVL